MLDSVSADEPSLAPRRNNQIFKSLRLIYLVSTVILT